MDEKWKGYSILWELDKKETQDYNYKNGVRICDEKTFRKIRKGEPISNSIYEAWFQHLNIQYLVDKELNEWLLVRASEFLKAYEMMDVDLQVHIIKITKDRLIGRCYPYPIFLESLDVIKTILTDSKTVTSDNLILLNDLLTIDSVVIKDICSSCIFWNNSRNCDDVEVLYKVGMKLPFSKGIIGRRIRLLLYVYTNRLDDFDKELAEYQKLINQNQNNYNLRIQFERLMEGYYDCKEDKENVILSLLNIEKINKKAKLVIREENYFNNVYYLATSYYWCKEYEKSFFYSKEYMSNKRSNITILLIYFSLCSYFNELLDLNKFKEIDKESLNSKDKLSVQLYKYRFSGKGKKVLLDFINNRYIPVLTSEDIFELKLVNLEFTRLKEKEIIL